MRGICAMLLFSGAWLATPLFAADRFPTYGTTARAVFFEGANVIRYGNWYGPGWWGGSQDPTRVGMLAPIDSLDAVAQKHDFGYKVAELLGNGRPAVIAHYMALADAIAVRDAASLPKDPAAWPHPPTNVRQAGDLRDRMVVGFGDVWKNWNALKGASQKRFDHTDEEEMDGLLNLERFEAQQDAEVAAWNREYAKWQAKKAAKNKAKVIPKPRQVQGVWVLTSSSDGGNCNGTSISIRQATDGSITGAEAQVTCERGIATGRWTASNFQWINADTLAWSYQYTSRSVDRLHDGNTQLTFLSATVARESTRDAAGNEHWGEFRRQ